MPRDLHYWYVTVRDAPTRTRDVLVLARSEWSAGWLHRQLNPGDDVVMVRPAAR
jgi:hypothetical protein